VVLHVGALKVRLSYTDVHRQRIQFLHKLLQSFDVQWTAGDVPAAANHATSVGEYSADGPEGVERFLGFLGSRLVFLIDWNRARQPLAPPGAVHRDGQA